MAIHHATVKKAAKFGISLTEVDHDGIPFAHATFGKAAWAHRDPKQALAAGLMHQIFAAEYPALTILQQSPGNFRIFHTDAEDTNTILLDDLTDTPELGEVLDACHEHDVDPEIGYQEQVAAVVVPESYKREYAERGDRNHCGDWLAKTLAGMFVTGEKALFDTVAFETFLRANDVDMTGKWADLPTSGQNGWQGRYRMNGRAKLEMALTRRGYLIQEGEDNLHPPMEYLYDLLEKHPKITPDWDTEGE